MMLLLLQDSTMIFSIMGYSIYFQKTLVFRYVIVIFYFKLLYHKLQYYFLLFKPGQSLPDKVQVRQIWRAKSF